jgi:hypothetical protein
MQPVLITATPCTLPDALVSQSYRYRVAIGSDVAPIADPSQTSFRATQSVNHDRLSVVVIATLGHYCPLLSQPRIHNLPNRWPYNQQCLENLLLSVPIFSA